MCNTVHAFSFLDIAKRDRVREAKRAVGEGFQTLSGENETCP